MKSDIYLKHVEDSLRGYRTIKAKQDKLKELRGLKSLLLATVKVIEKDLTV